MSVHHIYPEMVERAATWPQPGILALKRNTRNSNGCLEKGIGSLPPFGESLLVRTVPRAILHIGRLLRQTLLVRSLCKYEYSGSWNIDVEPLRILRVCNPLKERVRTTDDATDHATSSALHALYHATHHATDHAFRYAITSDLCHRRRICIQIWPLRGVGGGNCVLNGVLEGVLDGVLDGVTGVGLGVLGSIPWRSKMSSKAFSSPLVSVNSLYTCWARGNRVLSGVLSGHSRLLISLLSIGFSLLAVSLSLLSHLTCLFRLLFVLLYGGV
jgi:hypothetical protein